MELGEKVRVEEQIIEASRFDSVGASAVRATSASVASA